MNESQHDAHVAVTAAQTRVHLIATELEKAELLMAATKLKLQQAIARDQASWFATPEYRGI